ncbi:carotenoid 1,2-hydratase [Niveispirillum lacus]|nr:carotenoid 1,2-hydratase [Niveispirillum lacus]
MTERGCRSLERGPSHVQIGASSMAMQAGRLVITFDELALPWPGQRLLPGRVAGHVELTPEIVSDGFVDLDAAGRHVWSPRMPRASVTVNCSALPGGGWRGRAYHDMNYGDRPIEQDFIGWDWARGSAGAEGDTVILYDAIPRTGLPRRLALRYSGSPTPEIMDLPARQDLPGGFWGVRSGVACDPSMAPALVKRLEDSPFYTRACIETTLAGQRLEMVHETLDCRRLAQPLVRLMLPFRMPRRQSWGRSP